MAESGGCSAEYSDDRHLALAFKDGEEHAYRAIYERHSARVAGVCRRMLGNPADAEEAFQETFLRVYQGLARFNGRYQLGAWVARIATNVCLDQLRSRSRHPTDLLPLESFDLELSDLAHISGGLPHQDEPESALLKKQECRRVRRELARLAPLHRAAIVLRDFEGFSYAEIAETLELSECQVKALLHRARKGFRKNWTESLAALLPFGFVSIRLRALRDVKEQTARTAINLSTSATQTAAACTGVVQQCGAVLSERIGAVAMATVIAGGGITSGVATAPPPAPEQVATATPSSAEARLSSQPNGTDNRKKKASMSPSATPGSTDEPEPSQAPAPAPTPSPSPSPSPPQGSSDGGKSSPGSQASKVPAPEPSPSHPRVAVGFSSDVEQSSTFDVPTRYAASVDCDAYVVDQDMEISVRNGDDVFRGELRLWVRSNVSVELTVYGNGTSVRYVGGGSYTKNQRNGDSLDIGFAGYFGTGGSDHGSMGLPESGRFTANLSLDCATRSVVSETLTFGHDA